MDYSALIGRKVFQGGFKGNGEGTIVFVEGEIISVDFGGVVKKFSMEIFIKSLKFDNDETRELMEQAIDEAKAAKAAAEAAKKAAEEAAEKARQEEAERLAREEAERLEREKRDKKETRNQPIHPYIDERRNSGKHAIFLVCQNNNFQVESDNGFIWAPTHIDKGEGEVASHAEMDFVQKGDIIFHHFANHIYAISVARDDCTLQAAVAGHPNAGEVGRYVDLSYHILDNPASTSEFKAEKAAHGSMKYGPFDVNGNNKQGFYLSELHEQLATIFIDATIAANPTDTTLLTIKNNI
jgi:hypothetical protein